MGEVLVTYLRVNSNIITKEMAKTISCFLNNIIWGLDKILNKVLKTCGLLIVFWLTDIAKIYFVIGYYPRLRRAIIIYILYKEGKVDYLLLKSYYLIVLKNTLNKVFKRVIVDRITAIVKKI